MTSRRLTVALAMLGSLVSAYLVWVHYSGELALCVGVGGCEVVQSSRYANVGAIPVAAIGLGGFLAMLVVSLMRVRSGAESLTIALFALSLAATLYVAYLTYIELFVLGAVCPWCVSVALCAVGIFALAVREVTRL